MNKKRIKLNKATIGMTLADDVYDSNQKIVLKKGVTLTDEYIKLLEAYLITYIAIYEFESATSSTEKDTSHGHMELYSNLSINSLNSKETSSYAKRIVSSPEYITFSKKFNENITHFESDLRDLLNKDAPIEVDKLYKSTADILSATDNSLQVFDILHNLRDYDDSTCAHSLNVAIICNVFGKWLKLDEEDIKVLTVAGMLHDIGKLLIPPEILKKPGKLSETEFSKMKQHPLLGYNLLKSKKIDKRILLATLLHHEKCDGSGYPLGKQSAEIPSFTKIITIADIYEAMTANRVYRKGICPFDVISMFEQDGYQHYDPKYLITFLNGIIQSYIHFNVKLNDGTIGEIVMINPQALSKPTIRCNDTFINLVTHPELHIVALL